MASGSSACTDWWVRSYQGGWWAWSDNFNAGYHDGYCYSSYSSEGAGYGFCISITTPDIDNFLESSSLKVTIPILRAGSGFSTSGTLYFKLYTSDPTGDKPLASKMKITSSNCDASCSWSSTDQEVHKVSFTINSTSLKPNTEYFIAIGGNRLIGIGYPYYTPDNGYWVATLNYSTYTDGTKPSIVLKDNGNNTVTISGALGTNGDSNTIESATLYYTIDGSDPSSSSTRKSFTLSASSGSSYSKSIDITKKCTVKAYIKCTFEYNSTSASKSVSAIYYAAPSAPGIPKVTYTKSRLTLKENWKVTWDVATAANSDSPIKGYRFRIYKKAAGTSKFTTIPVYDTSGKLLSADMGTDSSVIDHRYYYDVASVSMTIDPTKHNIAVGDTIKIGLYAYTKNGAGTQLFTASQTFSSDLVVQNAGIVQTKVNNTWVEGQVYIKVNGSWLEAETVNTKVNGTWKESE